MDNSGKTTNNTFGGPFGQVCAYACPPVDFKPEPLIPATTIITTPQENAEREIPIPDGFEAVVEEGKVRIVRKKLELTEFERLFIKEALEIFGAVTPMDEAAVRESCARLMEVARKSILGEDEGIIGNEDYARGFQQAKFQYFDAFRDEDFEAFLCKKIKEWQKSGDDPSEYPRSLMTDALSLLAIARQELILELERREG